jgi:hypothetical protein
MPGPSRRSPGAAASASRPRPSALAAEAAEGAPPIGSVDSFQRAVLRRYEPLRRDTASAMIAERARSNNNLTDRGRWALTGTDNEASTVPQRPLGRWGVAPPEAPTPPARETTSTGGTGGGSDSLTTGQ